MDFLRIDDEPPQEAKPPPVVDITARGVSAFSVFCREVSRYLNGMGSLYRLHGIGVHRCRFNLLDIRAKG